MLWLVLDSRSNQEMMLCMPRTRRPTARQALEHWLKMAQVSARASSIPTWPMWSRSAQVEQWPYLAYDRALGETLEERLARQANPAAAGPGPLAGAGPGRPGLCPRGRPRPPGPASRQPGDRRRAGHVRLLGLEVAQEVFPSNVDFNAVTRRAVREAAEEDVVCMGLLLHRGLGGRLVLDVADLHEVVQRMQPQRPGDGAPALRDAASDRRATARHRQPRHRQPGASALSQRPRLPARAGRLARGGHSTSRAALWLAMIDRIQRLGHLPSYEHQAPACGASPVLGMQATHASAVST